MKKPRLTVMDLLSNMGMIGSTLSTNSLVPRSNTPASIQRQHEDFDEAGRVADPDIWSRYAQVMKRPSTYETQLQLWDDMSTWDLLTAALVQIVDEVCQTDNSQPKAVWYECNENKAEDELNDMLQRIDTETLITSQVWHVAALGNHFEKIDYSPGDGVKGLTFVHPFEMRRYWLERNRQCIGFKWKGHPPNKDDVFVMPDNKTPIERVALSHSSNQLEDLWYPWDFMHMRRMFRLRSSEHGEPLFDEAQGMYKKLRMALDQMSVHRAQVQPDRYVINIDTQDLPPTEQLKTIQRWKQSLRNKISFGAGQDGQTFSDPSDFRSFYNAWALDTIFYMARPKGVEHTITKLAGTPQVPDVFDIELLIDLFYSIIGMPKTWFGLGADPSNPPSGKSLLAQDIRFLRKVKSIRKPIINAYTWLGYFHMLLKGEDISSLNIQAKMPDIGGLEDQMKIDLIRSQADVLAALGDVMQQFNLPKEAWIELIFKKYLHLPNEVIDVFITSLPPEMQAMESRQPAPSERVLLETIRSRLSMHQSTVNSLKMQARRFHGLITEGDTPKPTVYKKRIIYMPESYVNDTVKVSNEDKTSWKINATSKAKKMALTESTSGPTPVVTENSNGSAETGGISPNWRRYMGMPSRG